MSLIYEVPSVYERNVFSSRIVAKTPPENINIVKQTKDVLENNERPLNVWILSKHLVSLDPTPTNNPANPNPTKLSPETEEY